MAFTRSTVTIQDVADAAGVSVSTVSRVLNDKDDVSAATYARVQQVIQDLGYTSSLAARSMRSHKNDVIGVVLTDMDHPFSGQVIRGISRAVKTHGYDLIAYTSQARPQDSLDRWEQKSVSLINGSIADGVIVIAPHASSFRTHHPLVAIDPHSQNTDFPAVTSTNYAGAVDAVEYLIGLGHRRIGFIGGRADLRSAGRRHAGYLDALRKSDLPVDERLIQIGDFSFDAAHRCALHLLDLPQRPTAIFAANDESALGVLRAATEYGLQVPDDLSVVGFDNTPESAGATPPLTSIDQSIDLMCQWATETLIRLINGEAVAQQLHKVPTTLVVRRSCAAPIQLSSLAH